MLSQCCVDISHVSDRSAVEQYGKLIANEEQKNMLKSFLHYLYYDVLGLHTFLSMLNTLEDVFLIPIFASEDYVCEYLSVHGIMNHLETMKIYSICNFADHYGGDLDALLLQQLVYGHSRGLPLLINSSA